MPRSHLSPVAVSQHLRGIDFPAERRELVELARRNDADDALIRELESMPDREFTSMTDITSSLAGSRGDGGPQGGEA